MVKKWIVALLIVVTAGMGIAVCAQLVRVAWLWVVPAALAIVVLASRLVSVQENTALVVRSPLHGAVQRVVPGPALTWLAPILEKAGPVVDTHLFFKRVVVENAVQADRLPTTLCFVAHISYCLAPDLLPNRVLGVLLPQVMADHAGLVQEGCDYCLRNLLADVQLTDPLHGRLARLERHLDLALAAHLRRTGIAVQLVHLMVHPPAGLAQVVSGVEQQQVGLQVQEQTLSTLLRTLAGNPQAAQSLAQLLLARSFGQNGQTLVATDLNALLRPNGEPSDGRRAKEPQLTLPPDGLLGLS